MLLRHLILSLLLVLSPATRAEIYKYYDSDGNLVLSDTVPKDNVEKVEKLEARPVMTVPAVKPDGRQPRRADRMEKVRKPEAADYVIVIQSPASEETYQRHAEEAIPVAFSVTPALRDGHRVQLLLDGASADGLTEITPGRLERGSHSLEVRVVAEGGRVIKSQSATFHVRQHSALNPNTLKPPKPDGSGKTPAKAGT